MATQLFYDGLSTSVLHLINPDYRVLRLGLVR